MQKLIKILSILIFTILIVIIGVFIWSFFNPYAQVLLIPLGILSIYYAFLFGFCKLVNSNSRYFEYIMIFLIVIPLISVSYSYDRFVTLSIDMLNYFTH
ncbi:hypothetical protein [Paenimyroides ceti]